MGSNSRSLSSGLISAGFSRRRFLGGTVAGLTGIAITRWAPKASAQVQPWGSTFVGQANEDPSVAAGLVTDGSRIFAYVCADPVVSGEIAYNQAVGGGDWFHGISLSSSGALLASPGGSALQIDFSGLTPALAVQTPAGNVLTISTVDTSTVPGISGLYRDEKKNAQGMSLTAGWILIGPEFNNNLMVGAIQVMDLSGVLSQALAAPAPNPTDPTLPVLAASINVMFTPTPVAQIQTLQF